MKKYIVEFLGTFFLVFTILIGANSSFSTMTPVVVGVVLVIIIYIGGPMSGAHYNPFVSVAFELNKSDRKKTFFYIIVQFLGALVATYITLLFFLDETSNMKHIRFKFLNGFIAEFIGTFALVWVILTTAKIGSRKGHPIYGLAIGTTVMIGAFIFGGTSGGAFNPAVTIAFVLTNMLECSSVWIHLAAQLLAAIVAALTFKRFFLKVP